MLILIVVPPSLVLSQIEHCCFLIAQTYWNCQKCLIAYTLALKCACHLNHTEILDVGVSSPQAQPSSPSTTRTCYTIVKSPTNHGTSTSTTARLDPARNGALMFTFADLGHSSQAPH